MDTKSASLPTPKDLAAERLIAAVESAIDSAGEYVTSIAANGNDEKWSVSNLIRDSSSFATSYGVRSHA